MSKYMVLKIYNTLSKKKEIFKPLGNKINLFVCGPTVYSFSHIGHGKAYVQFDVIVKYLRKFKGFDVFYLQNITDIDDKIINRSREQNVSTSVLSRQYTKYYFEDMKSLNVDSVSEYAKATSFIDEIKSQVKRLVNKGFAYETNDGVYFEVSKFKDYGKLSKQPLNKIKEGARVEVNENKKNPEDFVIWKKKKFDYEPAWDSDFSLGRPGWHIEDTAITEKYFGPQYDIHGGGADLIFPHHEAEIAQMESVSGKKPLVKYWLHSGFLKVNGQKMSKSLNNFFTIRDVLRKYKPQVLRYFFISSHYRDPLDFTFENLDNSKNSLCRINEFMIKLRNYRNAIHDSKKIDSVLKKYRLNFKKAMDDDFQTSKALSFIFEAVKEFNISLAEASISTNDSVKIRKLMEEFNYVFGIFDPEEKIPDSVMVIVKIREEARSKKDWVSSDRLRNQIKNLGYIIDDTKEGTIIKKI